MGGTDTFVAVSNDDEVNILSALLAKRMGARHTVALVNMPLCAFNQCTWR